MVLEAKSDASKDSHETQSISIDFAKSHGSADSDAVAAAGEPDVTIKSAPADASPVGVGEDGQVITLIIYLNFMSFCLEHYSNSWLGRGCLFLVVSSVMVFCG